MLDTFLLQSVIPQRMSRILVCECLAFGRYMVYLCTGIIPARISHCRACISLHNITVEDAGLPARLGKPFIQPSRHEHKPVKIVTNKPFIFTPQTLSVTEYQEWYHNC